MRLIIARHGETEANVNRIIQGHGNNPLSPKGREQAARLAERLAQEPIDLLYSSDLLRAKETAGFISEKINIPIQLNSHLRERCYGELEGHSIGIYESALAQSGLAREVYIPPGGESLGDLEIRASIFLTPILNSSPAETILVVAHAAINRALLKVLLQKDCTEWRFIGQDNTCVNILEIADGEVKPSTLNCTVHLG